MKIHTNIIALGSLVALIATATAQTPPPTVTPPSETKSEPADDKVAGGSVEPDGKLRLNFRNVPLEMVLDFLSDAAGFVVVMETEVKGTVSMWSKQPLSKDEAYDLLTTVLNQNGYAAIRNNRTLLIVNRDDAKKRNIPVTEGSNLDAIPESDRMVTHIIPVRYVNVTQLTKDLQPLLPSYAVLTANESGNALVLTATEYDIHRAVEIVKALDTSTTGISAIKVYRLKNADPSELANELSLLFPDDTRTGGGSGGSPVGRMFRGMFGGRGGSGQGEDTNANARMQRQGRVVAVPDARTSSLVVIAPDDLFAQIDGMIDQLDSIKARGQSVHVYSIENADPQQILLILQGMFPQPTNTTNRNNQNSALTTRSQQNPMNTATTPSSTGGFGTTGRSSGLGGFGP